MKAVRSRIVTKQQLRQLKLEKAAHAVSNGLAAMWLGLFPLLGVLWMEGGVRFPFSYSNITRSKYELALLLTMVSVAGAAFCVYVNRKKRKTVCWERVCLLCFFALVVFSARFGSCSGQQNSDGSLVVWSGSGRFEGLLTQQCYMLIMVCLSICRPKREWIAGSTTISVLVMSIVIALQYSGKNPLGFFPASLSIYTNYEFQGTLGNIDMVSGYLTLSVPLLFGYQVVLEKKHSFMPLLAAICGTVVMMMIRVQSGILGLAAGAVILLGAMAMRPALRGRGMTVMGCLLIAVALGSLVGLPWLDGTKAPWNLTTIGADGRVILCGDEAIVFPWNATWKKAALLALGAALLLLARPVSQKAGNAVPLWAVAAAFAFLAAVGITIVRVADLPEDMGGLWELHEILNGRAQDSFGSERLGIWRCTLAIAKDNLLIGTGPDTFLQAMRTYLAENGLSFRQLFDNPHNMFLAVLMQNGLPALLALLTGLGGTVIRSIRKKEAAPIAAGMICYLVQGFFTFSMCIVTPLFWAFAGMGISLTHTGHNNED